MPTMLVTGATGQIGSLLVELLADLGGAGHDVTVRAMVRNRESAGVVDSRAEIVVADFDDPDALARALDGVDALFLNTPSSERAAERQIRCADIAAHAGVERVVLLSQYAAEEDSPVRFLRWHAAVEQHVATLPFTTTVLRPNLFLQGLLAMAPVIARDGVLGAPIGDARVSAVDTRDIADVAAAALTSDQPLAGTYTLTGPAAITHDEVAAALSAETGHAIQFVDLAPETFASMLDGVMPAWQIGGLVEDYAHYRRGEAARVDPAIETVLGRPARGLAAFAHDYAQQFTAA